MFHTERELFVGGDAVHHTSFKWRRVTWTSFHTIFWYLFVPCSYIYNYIHQIWTCFCLWMSMGQTRIICSIPKTQTTSDLRLPGQTHTHTFWPVVIDMFKKNQKSQENESRAIKKTKYFHTEKGDCSCSWVRQLYPVFAPWHSSCKGGTCYHGQKVWVRSAIQELPVSFHHNTWGISSSYK